MIYYFAYGSNLDLNRLTHRLGPNFEVVRKAKLFKYKLIFDTYASIEKTDNPSDYVEGIIFKLKSELEEKELDKYEGVAVNAYTKKYLIFPIEGEHLRVLTYIKNIKPDSPNLGKSKKDYYELIERAYKHWNFTLSNLPKVEYLPETPPITSNKKIQDILNKINNRNISNNYSPPKNPTFKSEPKTDDKISYAQKGFFTQDYLKKKYNDNKKENDDFLNNYLKGLKPD